MVNRNWRLPDGVEELLPPQAWALEQLRRRVLDVFAAWGFDYVEPPIVEYLDALLVVRQAMSDAESSEGLPPPPGSHASLPDLGRAYAALRKAAESSMTANKAA